MKTSIVDNGKVACTYPNIDCGTFERSACCDVHPDHSGVSLALHRTLHTGVHQSVQIRFQYLLFAEILIGLGKAVANLPLAGREHWLALRDAAELLRRALDLDGQHELTETRSDKQPRNHHGRKDLSP